MKKYFLILILALFSLPSFAQFEIKTDALGIIYKNYGLGFEVILNKNVSVSLYSKIIFDNFVLKEARGLKYTEYDFISIKTMAEFKYFFNPKIGGDGAFIGGYMLYKAEGFSDLVYKDPINGRSYNYRMEYEGHGLGFITGYKYFTKSWFYLEGVVGVGRITPFHIINAGAGAYLGENYFYENNYISLWDIRLELCIGFRIGKMNRE